MEPTSASSPCSSPASGRKPAKIVSLFTQLMTPNTTQQPTPPTPAKNAAEEPVSLLGEEVDKLRKIIALHEGLMREASTPMKPAATSEQPPCTPARMEMKENKIVTNLLNAFEQQVESARNTPTSGNTPPTAPVTQATPFRTPAPVTAASRPSSVAPRAIPVPAPITPAQHSNSTPPVPLTLATPIPQPHFTPRATTGAPPTPLSFATPLPLTPPSAAALPPTTPAQLVPGTPAPVENPSLSNSNSPSDSDSTFSFSDVDLDSSTEVEEAKADVAVVAEKDAPQETKMEVETVPIKVDVVEQKPEPVEEEKPQPEQASKEAIQALSQVIQEGKEREAEITHDNKLLKGLIVRKDIEIRDLGKRVKELEQVDTIRAQGEAQLEEMKRECDSLRQVLQSKDVVIEEKATESLKLSNQIEEHYKPLAERLTRVNLERKQLFNQVMELKGNIRVFCRVRPLTSSESASGEKMVAAFPVEGSIIIQSKKYDFDRVFDPSVGQAAVFDEVKPLIGSVMDGYNVCLFCYGQTGSGKTFTMEGTESERGVYYRALDELFQNTQSQASTLKFSVSVSVMEIYNENVRDLLCADPSKKLEIRTGSNGVMVPDLSSHIVSNMDQVLSLMASGASNRAVGATNQNEHSSRSHCIVCVTVTGENLITGITTTARLHLVDLAGSERLSKTQAEGDRLKEAQHINKSLSALGEVVNHLVSKNAHIPYRNSKLTHLLMDCLGGDSKTLMFVHINPAESSAGESVCSLNFASRARSVENGPAKKHTDAEHVKLSGQLKKKDETIASQQALIDNLKTLLKNAEEKAAKADERYKNLLTKEASKVEKPLTEITNSLPSVIPATNYVSILRENPSTPRKISSITPAAGDALKEAPKVSFDLSASSKENSENGEERIHTKTRVHFAEELKTAPVPKRLKVEQPTTAAPTATPAAPAPLRPIPTLTPRLTTLRSATKIEREPASPMKSASWNNSLRGGSKVLPPPKRNTISKLSSSTTSSLSSLPQRGKRV